MLDWLACGSVTDESCTEGAYMCHSPPSSLDCCISRQLTCEPLICKPQAYMRYGYVWRFGSYQTRDTTRFRTVMPWMSTEDRRNVGSTALQVRCVLNSFHTDTGTFMVTCSRAFCHAWVRVKIEPVPADLRASLTQLPALKLDSGPELEKKHIADSPTFPYSSPRFR